MENPVSVLAEVVRVLEQHEITYVLVGSMASSIHGMYRATADIDFLADIKPEQVVPLLNALQENFDVDEDAIHEAVEQRQSFNAIPFGSVFKIDIFIPKADEFSRKLLQRRELRKIAPDINQEAYVATAEDTILAKLRWYRAGGEVAPDQWTDVLGVIGAKRTGLDVEYLHEWADKLGVRDLLDKAVAEAS